MNKKEETIDTIAVVDYIVAFIASLNLVTTMNWISSLLWASIVVGLIIKLRTLDSVDII